MRTRVLTTLVLGLAGLRMVAQQRTALPALLAEADKSNREILAAEAEWRGTAFMRAQVTSLPDPQFTLQELSTGSPRPGAGLSNNNFAYVGIGASQEFPYPGKLRLKGALADAAAEEQLARVELARSQVREQVKAVYLRLAYLQQTLTSLNESRSTLTEAVDTELARYSAGEGAQADILKAQLERTKLLREITMHHEDMAQSQIELKQLLSRTQDSADIVTDDLTESEVTQSIADLLKNTERKSPMLAVDARTIKKQYAELESARLAAKPDFSVGYMYQRTGLDFPAYYMATFNVMVPRRRRVAAEKAEAGERTAAAILTRDAHLEQQFAEGRKQYAAVVSTEEELKEYRDGILPQTEAAYTSTLMALRSNKQTIAAVLGSLDDVLEVKREYAQALLDHEMALVHLETLTGEALR